MQQLPDFDIKPEGEISNEFLSRNFTTFHQAIQFIKDLSYGRNPDKDNLKTVFTDNKGTCSTKHAILKQLADENGLAGIELTLGIFKMNGRNTPPVGDTLRRNNLDYVPEAHIYLKYQNRIFDYTRANSKPSDFEDDLLVERAIKPSEINQPKIALHKQYLSDWLHGNEALKEFTLDEVWAIREQCIQDLSK